MDVLHTAKLLERIALVAKLSTCVECRQNEREVAIVFIAEMASEAIQQLTSSDGEPIKKPDVFH